MDKIIAKDSAHLNKLVREHIRDFGVHCDLNHIDTSRVTNMSELFEATRFNGNISQWDTSNVVDMYGMFRSCPFEGDLSQWNVGKVKDFRFMFYSSGIKGGLENWDTSCVTEMTAMFEFARNFNCNISRWNVEKVTSMYTMFEVSAFTQDLTPWKPFKLQYIRDIFNDKCVVPYWAKIKDNNERLRAIERYDLRDKLEEALNLKENILKKQKI